jgi:transcriptional regulator with XRE-family HTH domain
MQDSEIVKQLGTSIAVRRQYVGLTQEQLAIRLDITTDAMSRIEKGRFAPKLSRLPGIATALGCSVADLFRSLDRKALDRATTIADILQPLPGEAQEALVELMVQAVRLTRKICP